jgi:hypothetical protein
MTLSFWLSLTVALLCTIVVAVCLFVRAHAREIERETKFWAELHDPPEHVRKLPR